MEEEKRRPIYPPARIEVSPPRQLLILFGLLCLGLLLGGLASFFMIHLTPGANFDNLDSSPAYNSLLKWMQAVGTFCMFALPALLFNTFLRPRKDFFYARQRQSGWLWLLAILMALCAVTATDIFGHVNEWIPISKGLRIKFQNMETAYDQQMIKMLSLHTFGQYLISLTLIALLPALFEELLFRGTLQQILIRWIGRPFWAIFITSVIFSAIHLSYFGFLPRLFLGMLMGYVFYLGKNIWLNICIHFINNGLVITLLYIISRKKGSLDQALHTTTPFYLEIIGLILLILLFYIFTTVAPRRKNENADSVIKV